MIFLDTFECDELEYLISMSEQVQRRSLNSMGFADVMFIAHDNHRIQIENKQAEELMSGMMDCEDQLRRQYPMAEESMLLVRGIIVPAQEGVAVFRESSSGKFYHHSRNFPGVSYAGYRAWLWQLDKMGVTSWEVPSLAAMASTIVAIYKNSQKAEHQTLQRYIKPKVVLAEHNDDVETLMGIKGANLGEVKAKELIRVFGTPWGVFARSQEELAEVLGQVGARKLLESIGRWTCPE